nr:hypothetical protein [Tanacetum cinerariifolium]
MHRRWQPTTSITAAVAPPHTTPPLLTPPQPPQQQQRRRFQPWRAVDGRMATTAALMSNSGCPLPNHHRGGGRTTVQPPQPHLVVSGCDGATTSEESGRSAA